MAIVFSCTMYIPVLIYIFFNPQGHDCQFGSDAGYDNEVEKLHIIPTFTGKILFIFIIKVCNSEKATNLKKISIYFFFIIKEYEIRRRTFIIDTVWLF